TCEKRGFVQGELFCRLAEVEFGGRLEAVDTVSQKYLVGVKSENLRLGEAALDLDGEQRLLDLAMERAIRGEEQIARQLHGECRCALHPPAGLNIAVRGADYPPDVNAGMRVEIFVFDRNQGIAQKLRVVSIGRDHPALKGKCSNRPILVVVKLRSGAGTIVFEFF